METQSNIIKNLIEQLLQKMMVLGEVKIADVCGPNSLRFVVQTRDTGSLVGEKGQHLVALNHLLRRIVENELRKNNLEVVQFSLDVNDYQAKIDEAIENIARMGVQRVRYFKKDVELEPMNSYDRRIVHSVLAEYPDIETESVGEGANRRVVIKMFNI